MSVAAAAHLDAEPFARPLPRPAEPPPRPPGGALRPRPPDDDPTLMPFILSVTPPAQHQHRTKDRKAACATTCQIGAKDPIETHPTRITSCRTEPPVLTPLLLHTHACHAGRALTDSPASSASRVARRRPSAPPPRRGAHVGSHLRLLFLVNCCPLLLNPRRRPLWSAAKPRHEASHTRA